MARSTEAVGIVGLGYVGLTTAACFAARGVKTVGIDVDEEKIAGISRGKPPFVEEGLEEMLRKALKRGYLNVTSDYDALADARIYYITVGTPNTRKGSIDLSSVKSASRSIGKVLRSSEWYKLVVVKSTVTPGTTSQVVRPLLDSESHRRQDNFGLAANPEFLREGHAIEDTMHPDRLVIGASDLTSERTLVSFYRGFYRSLPKTIRTTPVNAELIKYASNSFLATKISFINEIANLCANIPGADVSVVAKGMGLDKRIAPSFLRAGLGYGGSCFPKDVQTLIKLAEQVHVNMSIATTAHKANRRQALVAIELTQKLIGDISGKKIAMLGLAFKPDSDDMREAVSLRLIRELMNKGAKVTAYDPAAVPNARRIFGDRIDYSKSVKECLNRADCCIVVTEWPEFSKLRPAHFKKLMRTPAVVDGRRVLDPQLFVKSGVRFAAVGYSGST